MTEPIAVDPPKPAFSRSAPIGPPIVVAPTPAPKAEAPKAEPSKLEAVLSALVPSAAPTSAAPSADVPVFAGFTARHLKLGAAALASLAVGIGGVRMMFPGKDAPPAPQPIVAANTLPEKPSTLPPPQTRLEPGAPEKLPVDANGIPIVPTHGPVPPPGGPVGPLAVYSPPSAPAVPPPGDLFIPLEPREASPPTAPPTGAGVVPPRFEPIAPPSNLLIPIAGQDKPPALPAAPSVPALPALPAAPGGMGAPLVPPVAPPGDLVPPVAPPGSLVPPVAPPGNLLPPTAPPSGMGTPAPLLPPVGTGSTLPPVPPPGALDGAPKPPPVEPLAPPSLLPKVDPPVLAPPKVEPPVFAPPMGTPAAFTKPAGNSDARPLVPELAPRTSFDVELYEPRQNDSYDSISKEFYNDARFAKALEAFNRAKNPNGSARAVEVPPLHVLRKQYPQLMGGAAPVIAPASGTGGASTFPPPPAAGPKWGVVGDPPAPATPLPRTYRVPAGGATLREIARTVLGSEQKWTELYDLNAWAQPDRVIPAGTEVKLP
jgi:hypothetical protein